VTLSGAGTVSPTYTSLEVTACGTDTYVFSLTVTDECGLTDIDSVTITVSDSNASPVADAGPDQPAVVEGDLVTLDGSGSYDNDFGDSIASYGISRVTGIPCAS